MTHPAMLERDIQRQIRFTVYGTPQPQGSIRAFMPKGCIRPILTSDNKELKSFRQEAAKAAIAALPAGFKLFEKRIPVELYVAFYFRRPESGKWVHKTTRPDADKLARAVLDAFTGIIWNDDSQVTSLYVDKFFGNPERTEVRVIGNA